MIYPLPHIKDHILVIEDEEFLVRALKDNFEALGCSVDVAYNGEEAVEHLHKQRPDIILLDILMPKKGGLEVLEEIKKSSEWKSIPVIMLSNLGGDGDIKKAMEIGADDYFVKSQHSIEEVIESVKKYLEESKHLKTVGVKASVTEVASVAEKKKYREDARIIEKRKTERVITAEKNQTKIALAEAKRKEQALIAENEKVKAALLEKKREETQAVLAEKHRAKTALLEEKRKARAALAEAKKAKAILARIRKQTKMW